ncbi:MAG: sensor domain-containing diguanylate cyclase [Cyanobium sp.]
MEPYPDYPLPRRELQRLRELERIGLDDGLGLAVDDPDLCGILDLCTDVLAMPMGLLSVVNASHQNALCRHGTKLKSTSRELSFCAHTIAGDEVLVVPDAQKDGRFKGNPLVLNPPLLRFYAGAPLLTPHGHALGTLCVLDSHPRSLSAKQCRQLEHFAGLAMHELQWHQRSLLCPLTGLHRRPDFLMLGEKELQRARLHHTPLTLITLDLDYFQQINTRWGYQAGNQALRDFCRLCHEELNEADVMARLDDEEFGLLIVGRSLDESLHLAETLRLRAEKMPGAFSHSDYHLHLSAGLSELCDNDDHFLDLYQRSEQALDVAKANGKNQVVVLWHE